MRLNTLKPAEGSKKSAKRLGRGIGSGFGKTSGKGHKGQKARSGGFHKVGFEGGQMPIQRRVPKFGFTSRKSLHAERIALRALNAVTADVVSLEALQEAGIVRKNTKSVKVYLAGEISKPVKLQGIAVTAGARSAIEAAGGKIEG